MFGKLKKLLIGYPLEVENMAHERITKTKALAILSSDALSSVAYATEEILLALIAFSYAASVWSIPVALAIAGLLIIITISYRQTIDAYPNGGGAYAVAKENLGTKAGLIAGTALMIDYILTVAVSVSSGIANMVAAFPILDEHKVLIAFFVISLIALLNLRGIRESAGIFAYPTYFFILSVIILLGVGAWRFLSGEVETAAPVIHPAYPEIGLFLVLKAFSSGCSALTGIEAISNGIPMFKEPAQENAKKTMIWMALILGIFFLGITLLSYSYGITPKESETVISLLAQKVLGHSLFYYALQISTALILFLAANTSYAGFPILASLLAKDSFLPRQLKSLGDRLVFSNGIVALSVAAFFLITIFNANPHHLIPLYSVGVFLSFTLSQAGMIVKHFKMKKSNWLQGMAINAIGALATGTVLIVVAVTKFSHGAWIVIIFIPIAIYFLMRIEHHYRQVSKELRLYNGESFPKLTPHPHRVIVPVSGVHRGTMEALKYAVSISNDVVVCYVNVSPEGTALFMKEWEHWVHNPNIKLIILDSPFRSVLQPILYFIDEEIKKRKIDELVTVVIPEFVSKNFRHNFLHNQTALFIKAALLLKRNKVVTSVRYHLKKT